MLCLPGCCRVVTFEPRLSSFSGCKPANGSSGAQLYSVQRCVHTGCGCPCCQVDYRRNAFPYDDSAFSRHDGPQRTSLAQHTAPDSSSESSTMPVLPCMLRQINGVVAFLSRWRRCGPFASSSRSPAMPAKPVKASRRQRRGISMQR